MTPTDAQGRTAQATGGPAGLSVTGSTIRQLLDNPAAKAILDRYFPGMTEDARLAMAAGMTLEQIAPFAPQVLTEEKLQAVDDELKRI
jgi:hypothetical protein